MHLKRLCGVTSLSQIFRLPRGVVLVEFFWRKHVLENGEQIDRSDWHVVCCPFSCHYLLTYMLACVCVVLISVLRADLGCCQP